ncbi:MAG: FAD-dependent oxidoreductase [Planctomycetota bacterium]|nr:FAD-dependent oxidoreductase [Planctomycetota bacterium]MDA1161996.1 FAD-dependent oxidoreductase [Planctomycetota bacterium]
MRFITLVIALCLIPNPFAASHAADIRIETDLLIVGGTESGWAAAVRAARLGVPSITIVHDGKWLGGQFTEQALACVDENKGVGLVGWGVDWHPMKRSFHRSGLFKELMDRIEAFNHQKYGSPMPGRPYHGPSTFRPAEAEAIFRAMLQPYFDSGQVQFIKDRYPVRADVVRANIVNEFPKLTGLWFAPVGEKTPDVHVRAKMTIDASDWGEAIQVCGAAFECGADPKSRYNEPSASDDSSETPPNEMNPITWAMIVEESNSETPIEKPTRYDDRNFVRTTRLSLNAMQGLPWDRPVRLGSIPHWPDNGMASPRQLSVYTVRRIVDGYNSKGGITSILLNYMLGQDYPLERLPRNVVDALEATEPGASLKNIVMMNREQRQIVFDDSKRHSLSVLYHLQNFVHERAPEKANSFRRFHLSDEFGTPDNLPPKPYIREGLRLKAMYMMREQDGRNRDGATKTDARERISRVMYPDGVLCWQFHYDFHRTGRAYLTDEGDAGPWIDFEKPGRHTHHVSDRSVFPLRSLVPEKIDGLLGAQKNVGYSSIVCAAIRLHDQCIAIGEAAGVAAVVALRNNIQPRTIPFDRARLEDVRHGLCGEDGNSVPLLLWPYRDLPADHRAFVAINRLAARGMLPQESLDVDFQPDAPASAEWRKNVVAATRLQIVSDPVPTATTTAATATNEMTRGEFSIHWWNKVRDLTLTPFKRLKLQDADNDGILDSDDPVPFTPAEPVVWKIELPAVVPPTPDRDGLPDALPNTVTTDRAAIRKFNFTGKGSKAVAGFETDSGLAFDQARGFGWAQDISQNHRRRGVYPEDVRDTFLFTRDTAKWECRVQNGKWLVTVCNGDSGHEQTGHRVTIEGVAAVQNVSTPAGHFVETTATVDVTDERLTIILGPQLSGSNTCVNWLRLVPLE